MGSPCVWDPLSALCIGTVCWLVCRSSAVWLSGPDMALVGSCLVCTFGVPLPSDPLIVGTSTVLSTYFPGSSLPATTATTNGVCKYPDPGTSLCCRTTQYSNLRRQFRTSQLLHLSYYPLPFTNFAFPVWLWFLLLIDNCLSTLHRLSPAYPTPSNLRDQFPQWMPEFKAYKVTCSSSASLM